MQDRDLQAPAPSPAAPQGAPRGAAFLWGAATSAFQIEGAPDAAGKGPSIWDTYCRQPGRVRGGGDWRGACDHYRRWRDDIGLMARLNLNAYRFSVSWPRIQPAGRGKANAAGLDHYDRLIDGLLDAGIRPMVTLHHWDLPQALQDELGGWLSDDLPAIFADYASLVYQRLADRVEDWITINEPWVVTVAGYMDGVHPPGVRDKAKAYRAGHNLLRAHARAAAAYRPAQRGGGRITFALNAAYSFPASEEAADIVAAERAMLNFGGWFGDPACFGDYPPLLRARLGELLQEFGEEDRRLLRRSMDYIALNYYTSDVVRHKAGGGPMDTEVVDDGAPQTEMGWPIRPQGLRLLLHWLSDRYGKLPTLITENGAAFDDQPDADGFVQDDGRSAYLREHIEAAFQARAEGVDLRGYYAWSLLDNLEWAEGFTKRFGIVRCDFETQARTIKASGRWYADLIARGGPAGFSAPGAVGAGAGAGGT
jgi:beta-galactosidase